jgi:hypothetical protein
LKKESLVEEIEADRRNRSGLKRWKWIEEMEVGSSV